MSARLARVSEPTSYQAFQHFITHAPWDADVMWRRLRAALPERHRVLMLDEACFPKAGTHSVGVARQYCGALGKVANCESGGARGVDERSTTVPGGAGSADRRVSHKMAPRLDTGASHAGRRGDADRGGCRRRIRGQSYRPANAASVAAAVCVGDIPDADGLSGHARAAHRSTATAAAQSARRVTYRRYIIGSLVIFVVATTTLIALSADPWRGPFIYQIQ